MRAPSPAASQCTLRPSFLRNTPLMTPRTEWACHPVSVIICARVAPADERNRAMRRDCLLVGVVAAADFAGDLAFAADAAGERCCLTLGAVVAFLRDFC